jgi:hypothetical protein
MQIARQKGRDEFSKQVLRQTLRDFDPHDDRTTAHSTSRNFRIAVTREMLLSQLMVISLEQSMF